MSIRPAEPADVPAMLEIYDDFVRRTAVTFEYQTPSVEVFTQRLADHIAFYPWLVWEEKGKVLGYAYAGRVFERAAYAWNAEISCYLAEAVRGRGIGRQLYAKIEEILTKQGIRKVFALVTSANQPSLAFHRAVGYREAAVLRDVGFKLGQWHHVIWLEKQLQPLDSPDQPPRSWHEINI